MVKLKIKIMSVSFIIALLPLIVLGFLNINKATEIQSQSVQDFLTSIVKLKETALEEYIEDTEFFAESISMNTITQSYLSTKDESKRDALEELLYNAQEINWGRYHHVFIADTDGKIILSPNHGVRVKGSPSSHTNSDISASTWFKAALESVQVTDYSTFSEADHYHQMLLYPIKNKDGKTLGVLGFELMILYEQKILSDKLDLGKTGQIFLATLDGTPVVHNKGEEKAKLETPGIQDAITNGFSIGHTVNSASVPVIGFYLKNEKHPWILVAEIEEKEAFSSIDAMKNYFMAGLLVTSLLVVILSLVLSNYLVNPIKKISEAANKIAGGDFNAEIPAVSTNDEVQELGDSMLLLTGAIKFLKNEKNAKSKSSKKK